MDQNEQPRSKPAPSSHALGDADAPGVSPPGGAGSAPESEKPRASRLRRFWREQIKPLIFIFAVLLSVRSSLADWYDVPTGSMKPSILEGDRILVNKLAYDLRVPFLGWRVATWAHPVRNEIVIFPSPKDGVRLVKRIVGVPGDTIELRDNRLFINGAMAEYQPLDNDTIEQIPSGERTSHGFIAESVGPASHPVMTTPSIGTARRSFPAMAVPPDHYFMMGDNRDNSADSRYFGFVPRDSIVGRSSRVGLSLDPSRNYLPRWWRFLRPLP